ncbi:hypothetical protein [Pseudoxanthomonas wuyuanensis]|uniref:Uncharacterized protein n=1 Tax=Pseudoxanthomonas wuyuanensis TaxID=1073196 RepID=A0A286CV39_9GAMM|nr:hypothetical protein [Pseudoxanthomonas wuyuanensis]KAF1717365.1 hypothetical protein CSC75_18490 [Pseudoxanthomonas wuyuanensis]SOD50224.1 hypothetical protein SAMN06296416_1015 [Pseudoxanthomonas wuyuanensis]
MDTLLQFAFYALGFVGLAGISLIPIRSFLVMRQIVGYWHVSILAKLAIVFFALVATALLVAQGHLVVRIFSCLIGEHCGPNRASGWIYVAGIGIWYIVLEVVAFAVRYLVRKLAGAQPNSSFKPNPYRGTA